LPCNFILEGKGGNDNNPINHDQKRREVEGLTQADMVLLIGVFQVHISQFETGGLIPSENQTKKIAEILGLDPETLNKELRRFYEARKNELKKMIKERQDDTEILL